MPKREESNQSKILVFSRSNTLNHYNTITGNPTLLNRSFLLKSLMQLQMKIISNVQEVVIIFRKILSPVFAFDTFYHISFKIHSSKC